MHYRCKDNSTRNNYSHIIHKAIVSPSSLLSGTLPHKISRKWQRKLVNRVTKKLKNKKRAIFNDRDTEIVDLGASGWYFTPDTPVSKVDAQDPTIRVGTATGQPQVSAASCELPIKGIPAGMFDHIMPSFRHNLLGIGVLCDKDCKVIFTKRSVIIYEKDNKPFLTGWRETDRAKLCRISLKPDLSNLPPCPEYPDNTP